MHHMNIRNLRHGKVVYILYFKSEPFITTVDVFFVRAIRPNLPNPLAIGLQD